MDPISKRTFWFILLALLLHGSLFYFFSSPSRKLLKVSLNSQEFSTQWGMVSPTRLPQQKPASTRPIAEKTNTRSSKLEKNLKPSKSASAADLRNSGSQGKDIHNTSGSPDIPQDEIQNYVQDVVRILDSNKRYPRLSRENHEEGKVVIQLVLGRSGRLLGYQLIQSCAHPRLNGASLDTVRASSFPPLPASYTGSKMVLRIPVKYKLRNEDG